MIQEIKDKISIKYLKSNICFFLMIFKFEKIWLVISVVVLVTAGFLSIFIRNLYMQFRQSKLITKILSSVSAIYLSYICVQNFISTWLSSGMIERMASKIHLSNTVMLAIIASVLALLSLFFLAMVFNLVFVEIKTILNITIQFTKPKLIFANIKNNMLLIISSFAFMGLNIQISKNGIIALLLSYLLIILIFSQTAGVIGKIKNSSLIVKIYSLISTVGICYYSRQIFVSNISSSSFLREICEKIRINHTVFLRWFSAVAALISCVIIFILVLLLLDYVKNKLTPLFQSLSKAEIIVYLLITVMLFMFVGFAFSGSNAFWGTDLKHDIVYTSDSASLVESNVYLRLYHDQNDLRQPLFAVFSAPFIGLGYALSVPLSHFSTVFTPMFMNFVQVIMLVVTNLMLTKILNLSKCSRICFMLIYTVLYTTLLFSVMMEQYIVGYFWLIFAIYSYIEYKRASEISLSAAGGTLLTSLVFLPLSYRAKTNSRDNLRPFISAIEKSVLGFIVLLFSFGRLDVFLNFFERTNLLFVFTGGEGIAGRINQYSSFVSSCFIAPNATIDAENYEHISWQLSRDNISHINILGVVLVLLCIVSFIVNRDNILTKISAFWVCFSMLLLCIVGWGSPENGMILYSLYFVWAFLILLFQLIEWVSKKLNFKLFTPIVSCIIVVVLGLLNYQGIRDLLNFAFTYYPFNGVL